MPVRYDAAALGQATRTPQGFLRAPARLTRTGVLVYRRTDGTTIRELRRPEQVFAPASLATLHDAPVTDLHPGVMVTPANARELSLGHVSTASVRQDGRFVAGELVLTDAGMIGAVEAKKRREVSLGYNCKIIPGGGTYEGERYDQEQVDIVYNHVALGPAKWGRAGSEVALRLDGAEQRIELGADDAWRSDTDTDEPPPKGPAPEGTHMDMTKVRIDGIDCEVPAAAAQIITRAITERDAKLEAAETKATTQQKRADSLQGELDGTKGKLAEATDAKRLDAAIAERVALIDKARKVLGTEVKLDGKSAREIKELCIKHGDKDADFALKSDEYVQGRFDSLELSAANGGGDDGLDKVRRAAGGGSGESRTDQREPPKYTPPPWKQKLASTRPE